MKRILLILLFITFSFLVFAQAPEWQWVTQAGGTNSDVGKSITRDAAGNCYMTGSFMDTATFGSYSLTSSGERDVFVAKMDSNGNWLWATKAGGSDHDYGNEITTDAAGNCYVTGRFMDTVTFGSYSLTSSGSGDIFVAKIDALGNWSWATHAGGTSEDYGYGITINDSGNSYVTGLFRETATFGSYSLTSSGSNDIFVAKIDTNGNWLWATKAGGSTYAVGHAITIDDSGNSTLTGHFSGTATFGSYNLISNGQGDIFVAKLDANGNWQWATQAGGIYADSGYGITIDDFGNSYVTGFFHETATFDSNTLTSSGERDIFVAKMDVLGNWLWATKAGGTDEDTGNEITKDAAGNCYVTGLFRETATFGSYSLTSSGDYNIFVAKIDVVGNWLWATQAGGSYWDEGYGITIDNAGNSYVTGLFCGTATFGSFSLTTSGGEDAFIAKLSSTLSAENGIIPTEIQFSNFPNPFNPTTTIEFSIPEESIVELSIFNIKGQKIKTLAHDEFTKGDHSIIWNGDDESEKAVSSGIYYYRLNVNGKTEAMKKCLLLK